MLAQAHRRIEPKAMKATLVRGTGPNSLPHPVVARLIWVHDKRILLHPSGSDLKAALPSVPIPAAQRPEPVLVDHLRGQFCLTVAARDLRLVHIDHRRGEVDLSFTPRLGAQVDATAAQGLVWRDLAQVMASMPASNDDRAVLLDITNGAAFGGRHSTTKHHRHASQGRTEISRHTTRFATAVRRFRRAVTN